MARIVLTDDIWTQLQTAMKSHGCHQWKNNRNVMEAILWKLRTDSPWRNEHTRRILSMENYIQSI